MELRAYIEGIGRRWWLLILIAVLCWFMGGEIGHSQTAQYASTASVLIHDRLMTTPAFPSGIIQLNLPSSYYGEITSPAMFQRISQVYPRLSLKDLQDNVYVSTDTNNQLMLIEVTDVSPFATTDIANFLAQQFVTLQTQDLKSQLDYYQHWLQTNIIQLQNSINQLNLQVDHLTTSQQATTAQLPPAQQKTLSEYLSQRNQDTRTLYDYQQGLVEVQHAQNLLPAIYTIFKPATTPTTALSLPLSPTLVRLITLAAGLFLTISLLLASDFFTPVVRHRGELTRLANLPRPPQLPLEIPTFRASEHQRILQARPLSWRFVERLRPLRFLCATLALPTGHQTILLTSLQRKHRISAVLALMLANKGYRTLLIDGDFAQPSLHEQVPTLGPYTLTLAGGNILSCVKSTRHVHLFLLPATATLPSHVALNASTLIELLPELQQRFDLILIDAAPLSHPTTYQLLTKVDQILVFVKKRHDRLKTLQNLRSQCDLFKKEPQVVLLS